MEAFILIIIIVYFVFVIGAFIYLSYNNKAVYIKTSYKALANICKANDKQDINIILYKLYMSF